jgi:hypothetical protein
MMYTHSKNVEILRIFVLNKYFILVLKKNSNNKILLN